MGASASKEPAQEIYKAAAKNDVACLNKIVVALHNSGRLNPDVFKWADSDGRTALHLAASRNYHVVARRLLECGANVHYVNPKPGPAGGTALHDATRNRHEAMAELLLSYGANPFVCNAAGRTCMDDAVSEDAVNLLRRFELLATWRGMVSVKTSKLGGMSQPYKVRYMVVLPYYPFFPVTSAQPPKTQLWMFKDCTSVEPKARVWLDGATAIRSTETAMVVRLNPSHKEPPGDLSTRYDRGHCLSFKVAKEGDPASANALSQLEKLINRPPAHAAGSHPVLPTMGSFSSSLTPPSTAPSSLGPTPGNSAGGMPPRPAPARAPVPTPPDRRAVSDLGGGTHSLPPVATAVASSVPTMAYGSSTGQHVSDAFVDTLRALPGESDSDFASRLASAIAAHTGQDQPLIQHHSATSTPRASAAVPFSRSSPAIQGATAVWGAHALTPLSTPPATPTSEYLATSPSAPPLATVPSSSTEPGEERVCVICLSAPREAGYLHGSSVHMCVCRDCCSHVTPGEACPLCRQTVERVLNIF